MKLGLIGKNIQSSKAPDIHKRLGNLFNIPLSYQIFDLKDNNKIDFSDQLLKLKNTGFTGVNITFPFKEESIKYADLINQSSLNVKSSNTLIFKENIIAENTDYTGFLKSYEFHFKKNKPKKILVLGGGGVGRAITFALGSLDVEHIYLYEKDEFKGKSLIKDLELFEINCALINCKQLEKIISEVQGIVNCTPVGHYDFPGCPLGELIPSNHHWIFDVVYTPAKTDLLKKGEQVGAKIISGIDLFIFQALDSFLLFCEERVDKNQISKQMHFLRQHYFKVLFN
ncbi:hypothetical protein N8310_05575 [Pseudomonadota bacterium]|nr:hypothetical protein [Pseudomonadota bacterium]